MKLPNRIFLFIVTFLFISCTQKSNELEFWDWFKERQNKYYSYQKNNKKALFDELSFQLKKVNPELNFEFGKNNQQIRELIITADGKVKLFPIIQKLVSEAPKLNNWKFTALRQRAIEDNTTIKLDNIELSYNNVWFRYTKNSKKINITLYADTIVDTLKFRISTTILLDQLIGEYDRGVYINSIYFEEVSSKTPDTIYNFSGLKKIVDRMK